jgi:hypothetical protein
MQREYAFSRIPMQADALTPKPSAGARRDD